MMTYEKSKLLELYRKMYLDRCFELRLQEIYKEENRIFTSLHLGIGHEALSVGAASALLNDDYLVFSHRGMGHCIAKEMPVKNLLAEWYGKATGCSKGKGGVHLSDFGRGILGISGSQGGNAVIAVGAALSAKLQKNGRVAMCFFGEGTSNRGPIHEAMNLASVWKLPVIFICENDSYSFSTHQSKILPIENVADRGSAYDIPSEIVDGNDVLAVYSAASNAVRRAKKGDGPSLIEGKTFRWCGHHEKDSFLTYMNEDEILKWKKNCPIDRFEKFLIENEVEIEVIESIQKEVKEEIDDACKFADNSPYPELEELYKGVYANP
jgi:pyruvate dehydrogenase E1 component alpha subunit